MRKIGFIVFAILIVWGVASYLKSATTHVSDGFSQDLSRTMNVDQPTTIDPDHPLLSVLPHTAKAVVDEGSKLEDIILKGFIILLLIGGVILFFYIRSRE